MSETATVTVFAPTFSVGKLSSDKSGRPFRSVLPFASTTFAVISAESITRVSPLARLPMIYSSLPLVVIVIYVPVPDGITPLSEYTGREYAFPSDLDIVAVPAAELVKVSSVAA